jgi:hypothetical protein
MVCALDKESDRRGVVLLAFKLADIKFASNSGPGSYMLHNRAGFDLPVRWCSMHKFLEHTASGVSRMNMFVDAAISAFSPDVRARLRLHYGSFTEWMYEAMTFGIPHHLVPLTADYKMKTKNHLDYLAMRKTAEDFADGSTSLGIKMTDLPANRDVLLGKGKPIQEFRGNQRLSAIIDDYVDQYQVESSKTEKTALAAEMVHKVKTSYDGRFLTKDSGLWIEVSDDLARDKVSHMFRHQRQKANKKGHEMTGNRSAVRAIEGVFGSKLPIALEMNMNNKRIKV